MKPFREQNIELFWDTVRMINSSLFLRNRVTETINKSAAWSSEDDIQLEKTRDRFSEPAEVIVSRKRTFQAVMESEDRTMKTAVLNFANATTPGGGILSGSGAQEESLCRCSTLYPCLNFDEAYEKFYGWNRENMGEYGSDGIIYSPDVIILKTDESYPLRMDRKDWRNTDVITSAAPVLWSYPGDLGKYEKVMHERIRRILTVAANMEVDNLILGAFGCGAFHNPPETVARIFKEELTPLLRRFRRVEFAIMGFNDDPNHEAFSKEFGA